MSTNLERARELRAIDEPHYNCAQAVFIPFAEQAGLTVEQAYAIAQGFGGGMAAGKTCGALTGALMALGILGRASRENVIEAISRMEATHGGTSACADLLQANAEAGREKRPFCDSLIFEAIALVEELQARA